MIMWVCSALALIAQFGTDLQINLSQGEIGQTGLVGGQFLGGDGVMLLDQPIH